MGLRERFVKTLNLDGQSAVFPENGEYYVAIGAAFSSTEQQVQSSDQVMDAFVKASLVKTSVDTLPQLFSSQEEYDLFRQRHAKADIATFPIEEYTGKPILVSTRALLLQS